MRRHGQAERVRLVHEWRQQVGRDLRVYLDELRPGHGTLVDRAADLGARPHGGGRRVRGWCAVDHGAGGQDTRDRKSTRLNSSHMSISYAVFCLKKKTKHTIVFRPSQKKKKKKKTRK